ncbi:hypothetical protein P5V78_18640 [Mycobacteroides abscessus subsp. abscessus]|uniref:hypothetical protein n=1 Tax=Mycobacteroides abscessus TaxID=36809 RepID=UPI00092B7BA6|nr:hypothetical protein [Mycobacteroides abscessus]MDO3090008.1 hypothetical protein [Mycobacteroides abscessus subsp. abscessus]MDO3271445.1 hypothetical protein [Mycobacteroides abscessus subsp. abscessus]SHR08873.1 Uncharacterised protein [Mycobacteroides abscessus subsp. abscessus]SHZ60760.1 Uncharacterised protein [Mycobacteroides abscessus subsp. abscessus]SIA21515.1 Uncharacterised protein [Mycobacteroides abscessus subsp. abscessus]
MRMRPVRGYRRRRQRGAAALALVAAVAVVAALGCLTGAPRSWSTAGPGGTAHVARGPVSEMALPFLRAAADPVGADLHAPCPHAQLSATTRAGGNMPLMGAVPMVLGALAAADAEAGALVRGPPPRARVAAAGGPMSLHQLCVIRR